MEAQTFDHDFGLLFLHHPSNMWKDAKDELLNKVNYRPVNLSN